jgi:hypothetical protein
MGHPSPIPITADIARRFVLGRQGLWPGRRWAGKAGAVEALRCAEMVQIDPLNVVARSHDLALHSRVENYVPSQLDELLYRDRAGFDYGEALFIMPMAELPYWRTMMRQRVAAPRWATFAEQHASLLDETREELRRRGPLGSRDVARGNRVTSYRASHDAGLALYCLWLAGELMTHHRNRFDRVYHFREEIAPAEYGWEADLADAERFLVRKQIAFLGLCRTRFLGGLLTRRPAPDEAAVWAARLLAEGEIAAVSVAGEAEPRYVLASDLPLLDALACGETPAAWQPLGATNLDEVLFLAPLEIVSARRRAMTLFGFDYVWEVYKPAAQRRWGYYTLPILFGDRLVARLDPKLDRSTGTLVVKGFWLEDAATGEDAGFADALARGLVSLARMAGAQQVDVEAVEPAALRAHLRIH